MFRFIAFNTAFSSGTGLQAGTSYATGVKVAIQLQIPDNGRIALKEWGWTQDVATATATLFEIVSCDAASTMSTAHTTTTVTHLDRAAASTTSRLTFGATTNTGYGNGGLTSATPLATVAKGYLPQQIIQQYPLGDEPILGSAAAENFVQFRVNTTATVNALCWLSWYEYI